jgi:hypothetical protein
LPIIESLGSVGVTDLRGLETRSINAEFAPLEVGAGTCRTTQRDGALRQQIQSSFIGGTKPQCAFRYKHAWVARPARRRRKGLGNSLRDRIPKGGRRLQKRPALVPASDGRRAGSQSLICAAS